MNDSSKASAFPLSEALTRRVLHYLNVYRMVISVLLGLGYFSGAIGTTVTAEHPGFAGAVLTIYLIFAAFNLFSALKPRDDVHRLAMISLIFDIFFLSLMLIAFGGLENGLGVLLIFACGLGAILLPIRIALFLAAVASLSIIAEAVLRAYSLEGMEAILRAGLYGVTAMLSTLVGHQVAYWARDYRLIAEKSMATVSELEQVNELIIRRMRTGVIAVDKDCNITVMNESAWFLMGSPPVRQQKLDQLSPRLNSALTNWRASSILSNKQILLEPSQAQVVPSFVSLPLDEETGTLIFLADDNLITRRAMQISVTTLGKLSSSIAHEIRNPLAAASHAAQLLEESPTIKLSEMRLVNIIQKQCKRMNGIVENILQLSRREQSKPESVELHEFLSELVGEFLSTQKAKNVDFKTHFSPGESYVVFDRSQLSQCIWKLLDNAIDHSSGTKVARLRMRMRKDEQAGYCVITLEDNGPGIEKAQIKHIFEPFFSTRKEGSGLGLYIARQLCEANQSELTVDSEPGQGARFHIRVGLARGKPAESELETDTDAEQELEEQAST
ncbi:MAG TPA: ATP-binding protein [Xanthomonadales bacterium]|nr:ATP-binding protein [Xanthomonadales bacterium]